MNRIFRTAMIIPDTNPNLFITGRQVMHSNLRQAYLPVKKFNELDWNLNSTESLSVTRTTHQTDSNSKFSVN